MSRRYERPRGSDDVGANASSEACVFSMESGMKKFLVRSSAATFAALVVALSGCGGGSDGAPGPAGPAGPAGGGGAGGSGGSAISLAQLTPDQYAATEFKATITGVTIASAPVVTFKVADQNGTPLAGLGLATKAPTATVARYQNLAFSLAKLVPGPAGAVAGAAGGPSKWVSYIVTTVPTTTRRRDATRPAPTTPAPWSTTGDGTYSTPSTATSPSARSQPGRRRRDRAAATTRPTSVTSPTTRTPCTG